MKISAWLLVPIGIAIAAFVLVVGLPGADAWQSGDAYSGSGDWTIDDPTVVADEWYLQVSGNIQITSTLTVYNSAILVDQTSNGQYTVNVASGGTLNLYDSWLGSYDTYHYKFTVYGRLHVNYTDVSDMWGDTASWVGGIQLYSTSSATIENSWIYRGMTGGIYINTCSPTIDSSYIYYNGIDGGSTTYCYGIYARSDGTTSASISNNQVFSNYYLSAGTYYGTGIRSEYQARNDSISENYIYDNGFSTTTTPAGCQIYLYYSGPSLSNNYLTNGRYQLYAEFSSPPSITGGYMYTNVRGTTCYQVYAVNSSITLDGIYFTYTAFTNQFYGIYATSSSMLTVKDCDFYYTVSGTQTRYNVYASTYTSVDIVDCTFMNTYGSTYYGVYATSYCPVNISGTYFNISLITGSNPSFINVQNYCDVRISTSTFEATGSWPGTNFFYGSNRCNYSVNESRVDIWLLQPTSSYTYYGFQIRNYAASWYSKLTFNFNIVNLSLAANPTFYPIYNYNSVSGGFGALAMDNCTVKMLWPETFPTSGGVFYGIYSYYTPFFFNWSTYLSANEPMRGSCYGTYVQNSYMSVDNSTMYFSKNRGSGGYGWYIWGDTSRQYNTCVTASKLTADFSLNASVASNSQFYMYYNGLTIIDSTIDIFAGATANFFCYGYNRNAYMSNATIRVICKANTTVSTSTTAQFYPYYFSNMYMDRVYVNASCNYQVYIYMYGAGGTLVVTNSTFDFDNYVPGGYMYSYFYWYDYNYANTLIENCTYNLEYGYYMYHNTYATNNYTLRRNTYNFNRVVPPGSTVGVSGYEFYVYGGSPTYLLFMDGCTINYHTWGNSLSSYPYLFYVYYCRLLVQNTSITVRNHAGIMPVMIAYDYYGSNVDFNNTTLDAEFGTESTGGNSVGFNLIYLYNYGSSYPPSTFNLTNSIWSVRLANDYILCNGIHVVGTNDKLNFVNSTYKFNVTCPSAILRVIRLYDDPSQPGKLDLLNLAGSRFLVDVSGPDAQVAVLKLGGEAYIKMTTVSGTEITVNFYQASSYPVNLIELTSVQGFDLTGFSLNMNAPAGTGMTMNGVKLDRSRATISNMEIRGNKQGQMTGIMCDLGSRATIINVTIRDCKSGIISQIFSEPTISGVTISGCDVGVLANLSGNGTLTGQNSIDCPLTVGIYDESWFNFVETTLPAGAQVQIEMDGRSTGWCLNASFQEDKVKFKDQNSTLIVNQWLSITVLWKSAAGVESDQPVPGASVLLKNALGAEVRRNTTSEAGFVPRLITIEYTRTRDAKTQWTPYTASVEFIGFKADHQVAVTKTTDAVLFLMDDRLPEVAITLPEDGLIQNHRDVVVAGTASDIGSGLSVIEVSINGVDWYGLDAQGNWATVLDVPEGPYTITARVTDLAGNTFEAKVKVRIDLTAPEIRITSPADQSLGNRIPVDLVGTVEIGSTLYVNQRPAAVLEDGSFTFGVKLVEGQNSFTFFATDLAGNTNSMHLTVFLDITPPPLAVESPADGLLTNQTAVQVTGRTEPGASATLNGEAVEVGPDGSFTVRYTLHAGVNTLTLSATDPAGNSVSRMRTVLMDNEIRLSVLFPGDNMATNQVTILVRGETDTDVSLRLNDGLVAIAPDGNFSVTFTLEEGQNELVFIGLDRAGNSVLLTRRVVLDITRPTLEILSPQDGSLLKSRDVTVSGACEPGMTLTINGEAVATDTGSFSKTLQVPEGRTLIVIEGHDAAGNPVSARLSVLVDLTAPSLEIVEPLTGFRTSAYSVDVVGITEPGASVTVNGVAVMVDAFGKYMTTVTVQRGKNDIKVVSSDGAGNSASKSISVTGTTTQSDETDINWLWTVVGLVMALGVMLPLTAMLVSVAVKGGRAKGGSK